MHFSVQSMGLILFTDLLQVVMLWANTEASLKSMPLF